MPVIAIGVAIAADVGASAAIGSLIAGTVTLTGALEVVGAVGATVSAIGAVTHDKTLSTVGMVLGGIGGIGALASSAGLFGADAAAGTPLFGDASSSISDIEPVTVTPQAASIGMDNGLGTAGAAPVNAVQEGQLPDVVNSLNPSNPASGAAESSASDIQPVSVTPPAASIGSDSGNLLPTGAGNPTGLNPASSAANATPPSGTAISGGAPGAPAAAPTVPGTAAPAAPSAPSAADRGGALGGLLSFANKNPAVTMGLIQGAGSFLAGATSTLTPAQVAALNAQAAQNNAAAKLSQTQQTNISQPIPTASRTQPSAGQGGIINSPMPTSNVTGVAA